MRSGLLAGDLQPHLAIGGCGQIPGCEVIQVAIRQSGERCQQEQVAHKGEVIVERGGEQLVEIAFREVARSVFLAFETVGGERITVEKSLAHSDTDHPPQRVDKLLHTARLQAALRSQVTVIPFDKRAVELRKGDVREAVVLFQKGHKAEVGTVVVLEGAL